MITPTDSNNNQDNETQLEGLIKARIAAEGGRITFADFMAMALYQPELGYYTRTRRLIGARGDFYTAPHLTPYFGQLVAVQIVEMWRRLDAPQNFRIVEMGAGQGLLASDVLSYVRSNAPELWSSLEYLICEISPALQTAQAQRLGAVDPALLDKVRWSSLEDLRDVTSVFVSNELVDALPVHLVEVQGGQLHEVYITNQNGKFTEEVGPTSSPALTEYFALIGIDVAQYEDGYRTEVNLAALDWMWSAAAALARGYVLTIDYGYPAHQRYHPRRTAGTLQTYFEHQVAANPYERVGRQDITAHVDFTALQKAGEEAGLTTLGYTNQASFLLGLGLGDVLAEIAAPGYAQRAGLDSREVLARREALQRLINPTALGNFGVLIQAKNVSTTLPLQGLALTL